MAAKAVFLLVCTLVVVNCYNTQRSEEERSWLGGGSQSGSRRDSVSKQQTQWQRGQSSEEQNESSNEGILIPERQRGQRREPYNYEQRSSGGVGSQERYGERVLKVPEGQKLKLKYSSSSSSAEEGSNESIEIKQVEKLYHNTMPHNNGNSQWVPSDVQSRAHRVMNFETSELQNAIEKDM